MVIRVEAKTFLLIFCIGYRLAIYKWISSVLELLSQSPICALIQTRPTRTTPDTSPAENRFWFYESMVRFRVSSSLFFQALFNDQKTTMLCLGPSWTYENRIELVYLLVLKHFKKLPNYSENRIDFLSSGSFTLYSECKERLLILCSDCQGTCL